MTDNRDPLDLVRPLLRTRQIREFTDEPVGDADLHAITEVARWSGSSTNDQPWRFLVIRDRDVIRRLAEVGVPQTRALASATAAIVIVLPADPRHAVIDAYDDGRAAERILIAAGILGLGAGITFVRSDVLDAVRGILAVPDDRRIETIMALGHPTEAARRPKSAPGTARLPREVTVLEDRWPGGDPD
jgi:nitroreductase